MSSITSEGKNFCHGETTNAENSLSLQFLKRMAMNKHDIKVTHLQKNLYLSRHP